MFDYLVSVPEKKQKQTNKKNLEAFFFYLYLVYLLVLFTQFQAGLTYIGALQTPAMALTV